MSKPRKNLPKNRRFEVWDAYIGKKHGKHECLICNIVEMTQGRSNWHAAHVIPYSNGGDASVCNLRPICADCNLSMGDRNMFEYCEEYYPESLNTIINVKPQINYMSLVDTKSITQLPNIVVLLKPFQKTL